MNKKLYSLALLKVLQDLTDKDHVLSQKEIVDEIEGRYGFRMCRQAFRENINTLQQFGYEISTYVENRKGYYIKTRAFSKSEAMYLCHSVQYDPCVTKEQEQSIRDALLSVLSKPMSQDVLRTLSTNIRTRKDDRGTIKNLGILSEAIRGETIISFSYYHYNIKKERVKSKKTFEDMEPRFIVEKEGKYYLITSGGRHESISHFRVDKMCDITVSNISISKAFKYQEAYDYALKHVFMFSGDPVLVKLRCSKYIPNIYDKMIDEFGDDVQFEDIDDDWFEVVTRGSVTGIQYIAQKYIDAAHVLFPNELRLSIKDQIIHALDWYNQKE